MSHKLIQVKDIGNYKPEQLVMRGKGLVVVGVLRNLAYTSACNCCYSVVYLDYNGLHGVITTYQNGQVYKNSECYRDVLVRYESPTAVNEETPTNMNTECEFNIGNYTPEQLTLRNGLPVVAVFENVMDKHPEYSVVFSDDSLHKTVYVNKKGSVGLDKSDFDVVLKEDKSSKELLCEAWDLFSKINIVLNPDPLEGLRLNIFRDGSGHISKGFNMETRELFSFNSMSELIKGLKKL